MPSISMVCNYNGVRLFIEKNGVCMCTYSYVCAEVRQSESTCTTICHILINGMNEPYNNNFRRAQ